MTIRPERPGFTLIELLIYIGLVSITVTVLMSFFTDVTANAARAKVVREVQQNSRLVSERITQAVWTASTLNVVSPTQLDLTYSTGLVTLSCTGSAVTYNGSSLTTASVRAFSSTQCFSAAGPGGKGVSIDITIAQANASASAAATDQFQVNTTIFPRSSLY